MRSLRVAHAICLVIGNPLLSEGAASTYGSGYSHKAETQMYGSFTMTVLAVAAFLLILASIFAVAAYLDYHHMRSLRSTTMPRNSQDGFPSSAEDGLRTLDSREYSRRATPAVQQVQKIGQASGPVQRWCPAESGRVAPNPSTTPLEADDPKSVNRPLESPTVRSRVY